MHRLSNLVFRADKQAPFLYVVAQVLVLLPIVLGHFTSSASEEEAELQFLM